MKDFPWEGESRESFQARLELVNLLPFADVRPNWFTSDISAKYDIGWGLGDQLSPGGRRGSHTHSGVLQIYVEPEAFGVQQRTDVHAGGSSGPFFGGGQKFCRG